jgi:antitoxin FitA
MAVDLSIKRVPLDVARRLRRRAAMNHRSLQGELMAILEDAAKQDAVSAEGEKRTPGTRPRERRRIAPASESALIIRQAREGRTFTAADLHRYVSSLGPQTPDESTRWIRQGRASR